MPYQIPHTAIDQFRDATKRFLFTDEGALRDDAFGAAYPQYRLDLAIKKQIEEQLGKAVDAASQDEVVDAVQTLATTNEKFFQAFQARMPQFGIMVPFYDHYDGYHESMHPVTRLHSVNTEALGAGAGEAHLDSLWPVGPHAPAMPDYLARTVSTQLAGKAAALAHQGREDNFRAATADMGLTVDRGYQTPALTEDARARIAAAIDETTPPAAAPGSFVAGLEAQGRPTAVTAADIIARAEARKAALAEDPALGANSHPRYELPQGTTTPEGVKAARALGDDGVIKR